MGISLRQAKAIRPEALSPERCRNENGPLEPEPKLGPAIQSFNPANSVNNTLHPQWAHPSVEVGVEGSHGFTAQRNIFWVL